LEGVVAGRRRLFFSRGGAFALALTSLLIAGLVAARSRAADQPVGTIAVAASPLVTPLAERRVEGVLSFRGRRYLLDLRGVSGPGSSEGAVYGLRRARDIVGPYIATAEGWRNESGTTIRFDPPLALDGSPLRIELESRIYPKASLGQGSELE
jgi:hypothetical protein